ncbi:hypothetical protein QJS04_geneDACA009981 [Acorus gramineus]|uniref:Uncharacterized protein n=1 Tax=Acorus gramineus TaxID=55184 RepID=A0AAV9BK48_ACOGR|nr:hypothetical protein QJS04_geneDACA009981 [Acorus gramineus]
MNDLGGDRPKSWNIYTGAGSNGPSSTPAARDPPWKELGSSMNAISFGFVATAILISMFVIMAIFEHLLRPRSHFESSSSASTGAIGPAIDQVQLHSSGKLWSSHNVAASYPSDFSVLMPGEQHPTYIAQPAPLPCPREGALWPSHEPP